MDNNQNEKKNVTIYSTPTCHFCHAAKEYFKENNIAYTDKDVTTDPEARSQMIEKSGGMAVPVIDIDGTITVGFEQSKIASLLGVN